jgi:lysophospholipase L1-like esterase
MTQHREPSLYVLVVTVLVAVGACNDGSNGASNTTGVTSSVSGGASAAPAGGATAEHANGGASGGVTPSKSTTTTSTATGGATGSNSSGSGGSTSASSAGRAAAQSGDAPTSSASAGSSAHAGSGAGSAGTIAAAGAGAAGSSAAGAGGGAGGEPMTDLGKGDGSDVITIGDSWMSIPTNGGGIEGALDRAGTKYRHYSIAGTTLINGDIPMQYDRAKAANPKIASVIMTGGGNDVMFSGGCDTKEACTMSAQRIADALDELWTKMAADGVSTVVYIQYSRYAGTAPEDTRPDMQPVVKVCTTGMIRCISQNTDDLVPAGDTVDGIHPTMPACDRIAKAVLDAMEKAGARR